MHGQRRQDRILSSLLTDVSEYRKQLDWMPGAGIGHHWQSEVRRYSIVRGRSAPVYILVGERLTSRLSLLTLLSLLFLLCAGDSHRLRLQLLGAKGTAFS